MNDDTQDTIGNAAAIIERFGGIRPMAGKMGVPVTTVQGWKQRNGIPASRRDDIIRAAVENRIDLGDLLIGITSNGQPATFEERPPQVSKSSRDGFDTTMSPGRQARPLLYASLLMIAGAVLGGVVAIAPRVVEMTQSDKRVAELEAQLEEEKQKNIIAETARESGNINEGIQKTLAELQAKVGDLSQQAQGYSSALEDLKTGTMQQRLAKLESHVDQLVGRENALGLSVMLQKIQGMQQTPQGLSSLSQIADMMLGQIEESEAAGNENDVTASLAQLKEKDPHAANTLEGVAPEDMKAAAMLLAMAQMRDSLARDHDSFDTDLAILKRTVGDNPDLIAAIDRLAPQARQGVLTPSGLSKQLRELTGDIVAASLDGQDVSLKDKIAARMNDIMIVEKKGEQISGTQTQRIVADAQKKLDAGDVHGAVVLLKTLDGPAAEKAQPFVEQANATLDAQGLQRMLGAKVLDQLKTIQAKAGSGGLNQSGINGLIQQVEGMIPGYGLSEDPESGFSIYTQPPQINIPGLKR